MAEGAPKISDQSFPPLTPTVLSKVATPAPKPAQPRKIPQTPDPRSSSDPTLDPMEEADPEPSPPQPSSSSSDPISSPPAKKNKNSKNSNSSATPHPFKEYETALLLKIQSIAKCVSCLKTTLTTSGVGGNANQHGFQTIQTACKSCKKKSKMQFILQQPELATYKAEWEAKFDIYKTRKPNAKDGTDTEDAPAEVEVETQTSKKKGKAKASTNASSSSSSTLRQPSITESLKRVPAEVGQKRKFDDKEQRRRQLEREMEGGREEGEEDDEEIDLTLDPPVSAHTHSSNASETTLPPPPPKSTNTTPPATNGNKPTPAPTPQQSGGAGRITLDTERLLADVARRAMNGEAFVITPTPGQVPPQKSSTLPPPPTQPIASAPFTFTSGPPPPANPTPGQHWANQIIEDNDLLRFQYNSAIQRISELESVVNALKAQLDAKESTPPNPTQQTPPNTAEPTTVSGGWNGQGSRRGRRGARPGERGSGVEGRRIPGLDAPTGGAALDPEVATPTQNPENPDEGYRTINREAKKANGKTEEVKEKPRTEEDIKKDKRKFVASVLQAPGEPLTFDSVFFRLTNPRALLKTRAGERNRMLRALFKKLEINHFISAISILPGPIIQVVCPIGATAIIENVLLAQGVKTERDVDPMTRRKEFKQTDEEFEESVVTRLAFLCRQSYSRNFQEEVLREVSAVTRDLILTKYREITGNKYAQLGHQGREYKYDNLGRKPMEVSGSPGLI